MVEYADDWKVESHTIHLDCSDVLGRCPSEASTLSANQDICRICHCEGETNDNALVAPCYCSGSLRWVHQECLQQWIKSSDITCCELCKFQFIMHSKLKSFNKWENLQMSTLEKRKLLFSVTFHAVALTCVAWSLYVLIDRTAEELHRGILEWPFWTKLIVVAIGFSGGVVFMYIQCKAYVNLCRRWKAYNRVIYVQNAPDKPSLKKESTKLEQPRMDVPPQVYSCQKSNSVVTNIPSHSLQPGTETASKDDRLKYNDIKYKTLQVFSNHYSLSTGCDKFDALKAGEKDKAICKKEIDASSDEGETYGLLNV
ncbi:hypothetical protein RUM44_013547 [Polyplax serrata]|uniref:RING-CH-type domain-containing protein n=1 Tax=Polyplax serrata TaxID=468196 RepID=A0ABR1BID5_POLSC